MNPSHFLTHICSLQLPVNKSEQVAFEVECDIDLKSPRLLDLLSDKPTETSDATVSSAHR